MSNNFHCDVCDEDTSAARHYHAGDSCICADCASGPIVSLFNDAIKHEFCYPPKFGPSEIDMEEFADLLPDGFREAYAKRVEEYAVPPDERIYCPHKVVRRDEDEMDIDILNALDTNAQDHETEICGGFVHRAVEGTVICETCTGIVCGMCKSVVLDGEHNKHRRPFMCMLEKSVEETDHDPFSGMTKGKDFQVCPNPTCSIKIELKEACNHIVCHRCTKNFCFVCGLEAFEGSGHWNEGKQCPRFGHRAAQNAVYDAIATDHNHMGVREWLSADLAVFTGHRGEAALLLVQDEVPDWAPDFANAMIVMADALVYYTALTAQEQFDVVPVYHNIRERLDRAETLLAQIPEVVIEERPRLVLAINYYRAVTQAWLEALTQILPTADMAQLAEAANIFEERR